MKDQGAYTTTNAAAELHAKRVARYVADFEALGIVATVTADAFITNDGKTFCEYRLDDPHLFDDLGGALDAAMWRAGS